MSLQNSSEIIPDFDLLNELKEARQKELNTLEKVFYTNSLNKDNLFFFSHLKTIPNKQIFA